MFSFFKNKRDQLTDFSFLKTDMHSHLIPGIDDGAQSMEESVQMIRELVSIGYNKLITTPHVMEEYYLNTPEIIENGLANLRRRLSQEQINIEIKAAAEYNVDDQFETLVNNNSPLLTFSDKRLLIEFSTFAPPANRHEIIFQLNARGYKVILAHPERYLYFSNQKNAFEKMKDLGCSFQVNLLSLTGYYGREQKELATQLLKSGWVEYLGTDLHRTSQIKRLKTILKNQKINKTLKNISFKNIAL